MHVLYDDSKKKKTLKSNLLLERRTRSRRAVVDTGGSLCSDTDNNTRQESREVSLHWARLSQGRRSGYCCHPLGRWQSPPPLKSNRRKERIGLLTHLVRHPNKTYQSSINLYKSTNKSNAQRYDNVMNLHGQILFACHDKLQRGF